MSRMTFDTYVRRDDPRAFELLGNVTPYVDTIKYAIQYDKKIAEDLCSSKHVDHRHLDFAVFYAKIHLVKIMLGHVLPTIVKKYTASRLITHGTVEDVQYIHDSIGIEYNEDCVVEAICRGKFEILEFICRHFAPTIRVYRVAIQTHQIDALKIMESYRQFKLTSNVWPYFVSNITLDILKELLDVVSVPISYRIVESFAAAHKIDVVQYIHSNKLNSSYKVLLRNMAYNKNNVVLEYLSEVYSKRPLSDLNEILHALIKHANWSIAEKFIPRHSSSVFSEQLVIDLLKNDKHHLLGKYLERYKLTRTSTVIVMCAIVESPSNAMGKMLENHYRGLGPYNLPRRVKKFLKKLNEFK